MSTIDRRTFLALSAGALATAPLETALAQATCVTGGLPPFVPNALTVDCASRKNYQVFCRNVDYVGLTGVVSMSFVRGKFGVYQAGNLFLFPWLKKNGLALGLAKPWGAVFPLDDTQSRGADPIRGWKLPLDEYFCRYVIEAPWGSFIGFRVDTPVGLNDSRRAWFTNTKLGAGCRSASPGPAATSTTRGSAAVASFPTSTPARAQPGASSSSRGSTSHRAASARLRRRRQ